VAAQIAAVGDRQPQASQRASKGVKNGHGLIIWYLANPCGPETS
jgi:hypothetical protein